MQAALHAVCQQIVPHPARAISPIAANVAGPDFGAHVLVIPGALRWRPGQPGMEAASRDTERPAHPRHRPDPSVLRDEGKPHR